MRQNYYGLQISAVPVNRRWKWQLFLPFGGSLTSNEDYSTPEQALDGGQRWIAIESAFNALNDCLSELGGRQVIAQQEYRNLMESFIGITRATLE
jgi:hypothetical protein